MKPYNQENQTKGEEVREMFDRIAPKYDLLNHTLSAGIDKIWRRRVVRIARGHHPRHILDMATGTGDLAIALARGIQGVRVVGCDPSQGMLEVARRKVAERGLENRVTLEVGFSEELSNFADESFDVVTVAFGVRNFDRMEAGLNELKRVLRPGGLLVVLEFSNPTNPLIAGLYRWYSHHILPRVGGAVSKDRSAYEYLPASVDEFPTPARFIEILHGLGFRDGKSRSLSFGIAQIHTALK